jgi:hypothetical protein
VKNAANAMNVGKLFRVSEAGTLEYEPQLIKRIRGSERLQE